ncbi:hypothetical protein CYY_007648 [Polysphondylium violaceum]|uniref:FNIP repeat-containing protein n=1 Tax=Polysphondylium violaceum TaxID=133409 RepID=A0A8J4V220_9MYCE|nr:hypothetical protein CYY_007648 [Polysphondylium violaceum]
MDLKSFFSDAWNLKSFSCKSGEKKIFKLGDIPQLEHLSLNQLKWGNMKTDPFPWVTLKSLKIFDRIRFIVPQSLMEISSPYKAKVYPKYVKSIVINGPDELVDIDATFPPPNVKELTITHLGNIGASYHQLDLVKFCIGMNRTPFDSDLFTSFTHLTHLEILKYHGNILSPGIFPQTITIMSIGCDFSIECGVLPKSLKRLTFTKHFNSPLIPYSIPNGVEFIKLEVSGYKESIPNNVIPLSTKELHMTSRVIKPINAPPTTKINFYLKIIYRSVPEIPIYVTKFHFATTTVPLSEIKIPCSVTHLVLSHYNLSIQSKDIPDSVTILELPKRFTYIDARSIIPKNVRYLIIHSLCNISNIPDSVEYLMVRRNRNYKSTLDAQFPRGLKKLYIANYQYYFKNVPLSTILYPVPYRMKFKIN